MGVLRRTLAQLEPACLWLEALPKDPTFRGSSFEVGVATAAVRRDPYQTDTGYLTLLQFVNDRDTLYALLESLSEMLRPHNIRTLLGPTHLLPHLGGALSNHWHLPPPADTPYNPPYVSEHLDALMSPVYRLSLFHFETASPNPKPTGADVVLRVLEPHHPDTLLLQTALFSPTLPPPDAAEAQVILDWLRPQHPFGVLATLNDAPDTPAGFALVYPDETRNGLRRARVRTGRLLGGAV